MGRKTTEKDRKDDPAKKRKWVQQLLPVIKQNGISCFTMDQIAAKLERSKATIYKYFSSREEIMSLAIDEILQDAGGFQEILDNKERPFMERYIMSLKFFSGKISGISVDFLEDLKQGYPHLWVKVESFRDLAMKVMAAHYQTGMERGIFNRFSLPVLVMTDQLFFTALTDPKFLEDNKLSLQEAFDQYFRMKLFGILGKEQGDDVYRYEPEDSSFFT